MNFTNYYESCAKDADQMFTRHHDGIYAVVEIRHHQYFCRRIDEAENSDEIVKAELPGIAMGPASSGMIPVAGDIVSLEGGGPNDSSLIRDIAPRRTILRRNRAGIKTEDQALVANLDTILIVFGLDGGRNYHPSTLERSLAAAWSSGARPVIVLNKADCPSEDELNRIVDEAKDLAFTVPVFAVSARTGQGVVELAGILEPGSLITLMGKSGVGKSALVNALHRISASGQDSITEVETDAEFSVPAVEGRQRSGDLQGRHTTTFSRIYAMPGDYYLADLPGMRELQLWADESDVSETFPEIEELANSCRFRDCNHEAEPGCAVQDALQRGELDARRLESYRKLQREVAYLQRRQEEQDHKASGERFSGPPPSSELRAVYKARTKAYRKMKKDRH